MRTVVSLLLAVIGSVAGLLLLWFGGGNTVAQIGRFASDGMGIYPLVTVAGCLLLGVAALSVRWSRVGVLVVGAVHLLFSLMVVLLPYQPLDGVVSPAILLLNQLMGVDPGLATGAVYFVSFGGGLLVGAAMIGIGLLARRTRPSVLWRVLSALGGVFALGPALWAFAAGGDFYRATFQMLQGDVVVSLVLVVASLVFGALLAPSGRSAIGAWIVGGVLSLIGAILVGIDAVAFAGLPSALTSTVPVLGWSGVLLAVGVSVLGLALGVTLRPASVSAPMDAPVQEAPPSAV